ncbi:MAG: hypothetical protein JWN64_71 [Parcubacteria group bacterium]|nr:hypothetical protein [Parcubacteria group bacterium]
MNVIRGTLHRDNSRDSYWSRILLKSSENKGETFVYVCASYEYLNYTLNIKTLTDEALHGWVDDVIIEWTAKGDSIFKKPFHIDVKAITEEGRLNGLAYLRKEVVPAV